MPDPLSDNILTPENCATSIPEIPCSCQHTGANGTTCLGYRYVSFSLGMHTPRADPPEGS